MKRILLGLFTAGAVGGVTMLATNAFFSDTETSSGNLIQAGDIDLKVDNTCYYNGQACVNNFWGGTPVPAQNPTNTCSCTWASKDLSEGDTFFELTDVKPGDWEEDTISLTVQSNESWLCADVTLRSDDDVTCTEPESETGLADPECSAPTPAPGQGELANRINFLWWADDGDNVLEVDETPLSSGPLGVLGVGGTAQVTLADASNNIWTELPNSPIPQGGDTWYIGKGWCFGEISLNPVPAGQGVNPTIDSGFDCDGKDEGNETQTDRLTADISFRAVQARNNEAFLCQEAAEPVDQI